MRSGWYKLRFSQLVTQYWAFVIAAWILAATSLWMIAPAWDTIAADGDLAFLPSSVPSAVGQAALENAFPGSHSKSQMVLIFANRSEPLSPGDLALALDVARRLHWMAAKSTWQSMPASNAAQEAGSGDSKEVVRESTVSDIVLDNLTEVIGIEEALSRYLATEQPDAEFQRIADAYEMRGRLLQRVGKPEEAAVDLATASLIREQGKFLSGEVPEWSESIHDVWTWRSSILGHKLGSDNPQARLLTLQLDNDFTAVNNIDVLNGIEAMIVELREVHLSRVSAGFRVEASGSAAFGADMLRAAASGVHMTEIVTIVLVLLILATVYRAPFLVAIPIASIALSLLVATSVIALLAREPGVPGSVGLGVFTTTRIFVVVILFGAGTDFCLFFLARNRELLQSRMVRTRRQMHRVVAQGWRSVHDALVASALTTIVGLALMWFSRFQKFQFSGPIIAISLAITLLVCLTFTPAVLSALGKIAFWPLLRGQANHSQQAASIPIKTSRYWGSLGGYVVDHPQLALSVTLVLLLLPAGYGVTCLGSVTYDLTEELSDSAPSRRGARLISDFFPTNDGSPITVLLTRVQPFESEETLREACNNLSVAMYAEGVDSVRSLTDPLGDYPPGKRMGLFAQEAWRRRVLLGHRITREQYVSSVAELSKRVAKFDVILSDNPFSLAAGATLHRLKKLLDQESAQDASPWSGANITVSGTTVGITDLRMVTQSDQSRIQILVTLGVWLVLFVMLGQLVLSIYLIFTVLLSYFATLGITYAAFAALYGANYTGLDWKVPLFLFVILVAVGQDYNVYLVTRIFEERKGFAMPEAVRRAVQMTGGIITSCGFVMAGTFIAMTSPAVFLWLANVLPSGWISTDVPVLRGITELGFALSFGVLLDTLVVRSILVPSFIVLWNQQRNLKPR